MSRMKVGLRLAGAGALTCAGFLGLSGVAFAGTVHGPPSTLTVTEGSSGPMAAFPALSPPPGAAPSCPFNDETVFLQFVPGEGNGVLYGTSNKNGDWGGDNGEGPGEIVDSQGNVLYTGHLHEWGGGGNNAQQQTEGGFTISFNGSGTMGTVSVQGNSHTTTNAHGVTTSNFMTVTITCGS